MMNSEACLKTWNIYQSAWGPIDEAARRRLLQESVAVDCIYTDPVSQVHGIEALSTRIGQSQAKFPDAHFRNDSFLEHHGQGLFHWTMYDRNGSVFIKGSSYGRFGTDGRLLQMTGFFAAPTDRA
jgi:SnoaL-like domain